MVASGPSKIAKRTIAGTVPGQLDASQPARVLRNPLATLSFASFDPHTASGAVGRPETFKTKVTEELYRPKRIVNEILPSGQSTWRFVPRARWESGVRDEGIWPRVVNICGEDVLCSQDQWDIYKLDSAYDCYIPLDPGTSTITHSDIYYATEPIFNTGAVPLSAASSQSAPAQSAKRRLSPSPEATPPAPTPVSTSAPTFPPRASSARPESSTSHSAPKRARTAPRRIAVPQYSDTDSEELSEVEEEDEDEVEAMVVDEPAPQSRSKSQGRSASAGPSNDPRSKRLRAKIDAARQARRERRTKESQRNTEAAFGMFDQDPSRFGAGPEPQPTIGKRKAFVVTDPYPTPQSSRSSEEELLRPHGTKRGRTISPDSFRNEMLSKREPRLRKRKEQADAFIKSKQQQRHEMFMKDVLGSVPEEHFPEENNDDTPQVDTVPNTQTTFDGTQEDEEAARLAAIAESRRKLAELECDRPLWEESARRREASERAAAEAARAQAETMRAAEERRRQQHARTMREAEERARQAEARRAAEAESERRRAAQQQQQQRFARGPWTTQRALERYRTLCDAFDISRFGVDNPLRFERVPWPVLHNPLTLCIEDIDWSAVEAFFAAVRPSMRAQDYKSFVEKSQRRFHPDKWRSKLNTILDEQERESVDVAVGTVAQAITPLWRELKR